MILEALASARAQHVFKEYMLCVETGPPPPEGGGAPCFYLSSFMDSRNPMNAR